MSVERRVEEEFTAFAADRTNALLRVAYALTGNQHAAEDLLQNALAKAFARWSRIHSEAEPYVRRIIYHDFVSSWRRRGQRRETSMGTLPERAEPHTADSDTVLRLLLRDALLALPPRQRALSTEPCPAVRSRGGVGRR